MNNQNFWPKLISINHQPLIGAVIVSALITADISHAQGSESYISSANWTWQIFGDGFYGGSAVKREHEIFIDANWVKASWGLGISFKLESPEKNRELDTIRVQIKSVFSSNTKAWVGISSKAEGNKEQDRRWAKDISNEWQTFEFATLGMPSSRSSDTGAPSAPVDDLDNIHIVNLHFLKPERSDLESDTIVVRNLVLTFKSGESYAYQTPN